MLEFGQSLLTSLNNHQTKQSLNPDFVSGGRFVSIFPGDAVIGEIINLIIEDIRKSPWLIEDILSHFVENPYLSKKYGMKEISACKEWFKNNKIDVYVSVRPDETSRDYISVAVGPSSEDASLSTLSDLSTTVEELDPQEIQKPIPFVISPFIPADYDSLTGFIGIPNEIDLIPVASGQPIIDPTTGNGYIVDRVENVGDQQGVYIQEVVGGFPLSIPSKMAIIPQYRYYKARRERAFFRESYSIGCHSSGLPNIALWLESIVLYGLMRYREGLLEKSEFHISSLSRSEFTQDRGIGEDVFYSRFITLSGAVQNTWIKAPRRIIEKTILMQETDEGYVGGLQIEGPESIQPDNNGLWRMSGEES